MKPILCFILSALLLFGCASRPLTKGETKHIESQLLGFYDSAGTRIKSIAVNEESEFIDELKRLVEDRKEVAEKLEVFARVPFVIDDRIYYPKSFYRDDFSSVIDDPIDYLDWGLFAHEACHVFQYQKGLTSEKHNGEAYNWRLGLKEQLWDPGRDQAYEVLPSDITEDSELSDFYFEQQCVIFQRWAQDPNNSDTAIYGNLIFKALDDIELTEDENSKGGKRYVSFVIEGKNISDVAAKIINAVDIFHHDRPNCNIYHDNYRVTQRKNRLKVYNRQLYRDSSAYGPCISIADVGYRSKVTAFANGENNVEIKVSVKQKKGLVSLVYRYTEAHSNNLANTLKEYLNVTSQNEQ